MRENWQLTTANNYKVHLKTLKLLIYYARRSKVNQFIAASKVLPVLTHKRDSNCAKNELLMCLREGKRDAEHANQL